MKKGSIGYKVVRPLQYIGAKERLLSAATYDSDWAVVYSQGFPTYGRKGTPLFAFDTLAHAKHFCRVHFARRQVWKARLYRPKLRKRLASGAYYFMKYWAGKRLGITMGTPAGTLACESITLLEKVE